MINKFQCLLTNFDLYQSDTSLNSTSQGHKDFEFFRRMIIVQKFFTEENYVSLKCLSVSSVCNAI